MTGPIGPTWLFVVMAAVSVLWWLLWRGLLFAAGVAAVVVALKILGVL